MSKYKKPFKKKRIRTFNKKNLKSAVLSVFYERDDKSANYKQISSQLKIKDEPTRQLVNVVLEELKEGKHLVEVARGKFKLNKKPGSIFGVVELQPQGSAFVNSEQVDKPIRISSRNLNHAMEGDKVRVNLFARRRKQHLEGEVVEIIERAQTMYVGKVQVSSNFAFLVPARNAGFDIFIPIEKLNGAKNGQKAIAEIREWQQNAKNPIGEITEVLGNSGENDVEMHAILAEFELPHEFPQKIEEAANKFQIEIPAEEIKKRKDFRKVTTFTIDPHDAKDFDDALSIRRLPNDNWEVGVHIADVTHYVTPKSIIEDEAQKRATSVYLVDRVVPMLPENLSNGVCSLRPNEEKLCFSAVFELNEHADVQKQWFGRTIIYSDRRFSYEEAQEVIETKNGDLADEVLKLDQLAKKLREKRFTKGSINFDRVEMQFQLDEHGKPLSVSFKESKDANKLIEEFMLLANKKVAEFIGNPKGNKSPKTFVYRIHDKPDPEKLMSFNNFIHKFGYGIQLNSDKTIANSLNRLLKNVKGSKEQDVVEQLAIRAMSKAEYSTRNIGHYGLSFDYYTHFTSPIRRYPDMMVHRLLQHYLDGEKSADEQLYEDLCRHSSNMENRAAQAERTSIKYKQVEFMQQHIGEEYKGTISGIAEWGVYVELENKIEGMIPIRELDDDFYEYIEDDYMLVGRHNKRKFELGDDLIVKIWRTNLERKQLDFQLIQKI